MKQIAHVGDATNGQNEVVIVRLAKQVVAATEADIHTCLVRVVVVVVRLAETCAVNWRCHGCC